MPAVPRASALGEAQLIARIYPRPGIPAAMYVYLHSQTAGEDKHGRWGDLYTVGFYAPDGKWHPEKDCTSEEEAARRVAWLNGSGGSNP